MCMWPLRNPGVTTRFRASITRSALAFASAAALPTRLRLPFSTRIEPSWMIRRSGSTVMMYRALSILRLSAGMAVLTSARSPALGLRPALLGEGLHALLVVLTVEAVGDQLVEHRQVAVVVGLHELVDGSLRRLERERRVARHRQRVVAGEGFELRLRHDLVHQAHAQRVLRAEVGARGEEDLLRVGRADQLHQLFHALVVVAEAQARRRDAEARVVGGDAHVAADGDADAAAHPVTV